MLAVDLSIWISGVDQMDSVHLEGLQMDSLSKWERAGDLISQWEAELLQEKLQELLQDVDDDDVKTQVWRMNTAPYINSETLDVVSSDSLFLAQDTNELRSLGTFLQANKDLGERFSTELKAIDSLEAREWKRRKEEVNRSSTICYRLRL